MEDEHCCDGVEDGMMVVMAFCGMYCSTKDTTVRVMKNGSTMASIGKTTTFASFMPLHSTSSFSSDSESVMTSASLFLSSAQLTPSNSFSLCGSLPRDAAISSSILEGFMSVWGELNTLVPVRRMLMSTVTSGIKIMTEKTAPNVQVTICSNVREFVRSADQLFLVVI